MEAVSKYSESLNEASNASKMTILGAYIIADECLNELKGNKPKFTEKTVLTMYKGRLVNKTVRVYEAESAERTVAREKLRDAIGFLQAQGEPVTDGKLDIQRLRDAKALVKWKQIKPETMVTIDARRKVYKSAMEVYSERFVAGFRAPARH